MALVTSTNLPYVLGTDEYNLLTDTGSANVISYIDEQVTAYILSHIAGGTVDIATALASRTVAMIALLLAPSFCFQRNSQVVRLTYGGVPDWVGLMFERGTQLLKSIAAGKLVVVTGSSLNTILPKTDIDAPIKVYTSEYLETLPDLVK